MTSALRGASLPRRSHSAQRAYGLSDDFARQSDALHQMEQDWYEQRNAGSRAAHSDSEDSQRGSPTKLTRSPGVGRQRHPEAASLERRKQRGLVVPPPEQRFLPPSARKGTDEADRRQLLAHLHEVDAAMARIRRSSSKDRERALAAKKVKAQRPGSSMPASPKLQRRPIERATLPPYSPQLLKKAASSGQQLRFDLHANASSSRTSEPAQRHVGAPSPASSRSSHPSTSTAASSRGSSASRHSSQSAHPSPVRLMQGQPGSQQRSQLPMKESHVSISALLSAPARMMRDDSPERRVRRMQAAAAAASDDATSAARSDASAATSRSRSSTWSAARSAGGPRRHPSDDAEHGVGRQGSEFGFVRRHSTGAELPAVPEEPTPPRAVPAAALRQAQAHPALPQGPFAFGAEPLPQPPAQPLRRYSSLPSPHKRLPSALKSTSSRTASKVSGPAQRQLQLQDAPGGSGANKDSDGSDWEDASRWLEPAAPGVAATLRSALAALAVRTPPSNGRRRHVASAPGSPRGTPRRGGASGGSSRRVSFTQPVAWTPAGAGGSAKKRWFEKIGDAADGAQLSVARKTPLPRRPLAIDPSARPDSQDAAEDPDAPVPSNIAGLLEEASDDHRGGIVAADPAAEVPAPLVAPQPEQLEVVDETADASEAGSSATVLSPQLPTTSELSAVSERPAEEEEAAAAAAQATSAPQEFPLSDDGAESSADNAFADACSGASSPAEPLAPAVELEAAPEQAPMSACAEDEGTSAPMPREKEPCPSWPADQADSSEARPRAVRRLTRQRRLMKSPPDAQPATPPKPARCASEAMTPDNLRPGIPSGSAAKRLRVSPPEALKAPEDLASPQRDLDAVPRFLLPPQDADEPQRTEQQFAAEDEVAGPAQAADADQAAEFAAAQQHAAADTAAFAPDSEAAEPVDSPAPQDVDADGAASVAQQSEAGCAHQADDNEGALRMSAHDEVFLANFNEDDREEEPEEMSPPSPASLASGTSALSDEEEYVAVVTPELPAAEEAFTAGEADSSDDSVYEEAEEGPDTCDTFERTARRVEMALAEVEAAATAEAEAAADSQFLRRSISPSPKPQALDAAAEAVGERVAAEEHSGCSSQPSPRGGVSSEITPNLEPLRIDEAAAAAADVALDVTVAEHTIGAAMLAVQPAMAEAAAGDVVAALTTGSSMHKSWIKTAKRASSGSVRRITCSIAKGQVRLGYARGGLRRNVSTELQSAFGSKTCRTNVMSLPAGVDRVYLLEGTALAVDTAAGVLILRPADVRLHALWVLGMNAALVLATGFGSAQQSIAELPWSSEIKLDDHVV